MPGVDLDPLVAERLLKDNVTVTMLSTPEGLAEIFKHSGKMGRSCKWWELGRHRHAVADFLRATKGRMLKHVVFAEQCLRFVEREWKGRCAPTRQTG